MADEPQITHYVGDRCEPDGHRSDKPKGDGRTSDIFCPDHPAAFLDDCRHEAPNAQSSPLEGKE